MSQRAVKGIALFCAASLAMALFTGCKKKEVEAEAEKSGWKVGYATEAVTIVDDPNALQDAMDKMNEDSEKGISLLYQNDAISYNGIDFECYLGNSSDNAYDMFIAIYADSEFTDELYVSQLLRPGSAFENIRLNRPLELGVHRVYAAFTQVEEIDGEQAIHAQTLITLDFHVIEA